MRHILLVAAMALVGSHVTHANAGEPLPLVRNCTIIAPAEEGKPRLVLVDSKNGESITTYVQINGPTKLSGPLDAITISIEPFDTAITVRGLAPKADATFVRAIVTDGWESLLDGIRRGETLTLSAGEETTTISLAGSGLAVAALQRCSK